MKVKLFTHTDLDGIGCSILGKIAFTDMDITYCYTPDDTSEKVKDFIIKEEYKNYDYVYITDISVNEDVAELITNTHPDTFKDGFNLGEMFQLLDHHPTAEFLNKYFWAYITIEKDGEKTSGTRMFYDLLIEDEDLQNSYSWKNDRCEKLFEFVETVRKYDTWLWKTKYNDNESKQWNDLLYIIGREDFIDKIIHIINYENNFEFEYSDIKLLQYKQKEIDKYIESKSKQIINKEILGYKAGIVFAEQYHSELGNVLSELNPELDFIVIINPSTSVSYRTIKDNVDLGKDIAKVFGGGGHPKAAGSPISEDIREKIIDFIFH